MPRRSCGHYRGESPRCATCITYEEAKFLRKLERKPIEVPRENPIAAPSTSATLVSIADEGSTPLPTNIVMETVNEPESTVDPVSGSVADPDPSHVDSIVPSVPITVPTVPTVPSVPSVPTKSQPSFFAWSETSQTIQSIATFQYVMFEKTPFILLPGGWSMTVEQGYTSPTHFIVPTDGLYSIGYKVDVRSTNISGLISSVNSATVLTKNGEQIGGSASLVEFPLGNRQ